MDDPLGSRLFVVCGKTAEVRQHPPLSTGINQWVLYFQEDMLKTAFEPYGNVVNVKVIRDKGGELYSILMPRA